MAFVCVVTGRDRAVLVFFAKADHLSNPLSVGGVAPCSALWNVALVCVLGETPTFPITKLQTGGAFLVASTVLRRVRLDIDRFHGFGWLFQLSVPSTSPKGHLWLCLYAGPVACLRVLAGFGGHGTRVEFGVKLFGAVLEPFF